MVVDDGVDKVVGNSNFLVGGTYEEEEIAGVVEQCTSVAFVQ